MDLANARGAKWWKANDREATLTNLIASGLNYEAIAGVIGTSVGAVCGKANRMGVNRGGPNCGPGGGQPPQPFFWRGKPVIASHEPPDGVYLEIVERQTEEAERRGNATIALENTEEHHCKFIIGEATLARCCGVRRVPGLSYCEEHAELCISRLQHKERDAMAAAQPGPIPRLSAFNWGTPVGRLAIDPRTFEIADAHPSST